METEKQRTLILDDQARDKPLPTVQVEEPTDYLSRTEVVSQGKEKFHE